MDIQVLIRKLVSYGVQTGLVPEEDVIYTTNRLLELFELDELEERDNVTMREDELEEVLKGMLDYAYEKGIASAYLSVSAYSHFPEGLVRWD